jgi:POT family proton-dependent oligopeptide transporter
MAKERHPRGLTVLFMTEMWERFSFYLMVGILPQFLRDTEKGGMGWSDADQAALVGTYMALVYFTPFIGGLLADRLLGFRNTILIGGTLMMIGHIVLALPGEMALYAGLGFLILGNGAFKPNISTLLGNLYPPGSSLKDAGYNIFYLGINVGAFACNFVAAFVRNYFNSNPELGVNGWHAAFATAGVGMFIGLVIFGLNYGRFAAADIHGRQDTGPRASLTPLWIQCLLPAAIMGGLCGYAAYVFKLPLKPVNAGFIGACIPVVLFYYNVWRKVDNVQERGSVAALLTIFGVVVVFWMTFGLNTNALNVWAQHNTDRQPGRFIQLLTEQFDVFAEDADPSYFKNAGPDVPRPHPSNFEVVSKDRYKELAEAHKLQSRDGRTIVTQEQLDAIFNKRRMTDTTPILEPGESLKLANVELFSSINAGFVILFTPLLVGVWHWLRQRGKEPSTPGKIGLGLLITAGSPLVMLLATVYSNDGEYKVSAWWLFGTYAVVTVGELCLSPMGLALVNKMAPLKIQAFMMGGWFLSTSFGQKLAGLFGEAYAEWDHYVFWTVLIVCDLVFAGAIFMLLPWLKRQMGVEEAIHEVEEHATDV